MVYKPIFASPCCFFQPSCVRDVHGLVVRARPRVSTLEPPAQSADIAPLRAPLRQARCHEALARATDNHPKPTQTVPTPARNPHKTHRKHTKNKTKNKTKNRTHPFRTETPRSIGATKGQFEPSQQPVRKLPGTRVTGAHPFVGDLGEASNHAEQKSAIFSFIYQSI